MSTVDPSDFANLAREIEGAGTTRMTAGEAKERLAQPIVKADEWLVEPIPGEGEESGKGIIHGGFMSIDPVFGALHIPTTQNEWIAANPEPEIVKPPGKACLICNISVRPDGVNVFFVGTIGTFSKILPTLSQKMAKNGLFDIEFFDEFNDAGELVGQSSTQQALILCNRCFMVNWRREGYQKTPAIYLGLDWAFETGTEAGDDEKELLNALGDTSDAELV